MSISSRSTQIPMLVTPGDRLGHFDDLGPPGSGAYVDEQRLFSAICGIQDKASVTSLGAQAFGIGDTVLCRVVRLQQDKAEVTLLAVKQELTWVRFRTRVARGQIRKQDVRSFEIDQVSVSDCFRIGDVVQAKVVAKTSPFVLLSTTADNMGVVLATSIANAPMRPVSWEYMICTATGKKELRKVAKPVAGNARG
eukprot:GEMP01072091.1.p1 GENE.GEMP01072091.1~~GEMP01072091.1.p1  ORF type:complete len:195 (+),score=37.29 GEMP01072091.1:385-969(+)